MGSFDSLVLLAVLWMTPMLLIGIQATIDSETLFLERGERGIVPCPPTKCGDLTPDDIDGMFWYFGQLDAENTIISFFAGKVAPINGIPEGVYDVARNLNLIIQNVTDSDEGRYYFKLVPTLGERRNGFVNVAVKVSARQSFPTVLGCHPRPMAWTENCNVCVPYDTKTYILSCEVYNTKPAVKINWLRVLQDGHTELAQATQTIQHVVKPSSFWINNTYTTSSSIQVSPTNDDNTTCQYRCEAYGIALGDKDTQYLLVTVNKEAPPIHAADVPNVQNTVLIVSLAVVIPILIIVSCLMMVLLLWVMRRRKRSRWYPTTNADAGRDEEYMPLNARSGEAVDQRLDAVSTSQKPQWERLASILGFSQSRIAYFKYLAAGEPEKLTWRMLTEWRGQQSTPEVQTARLADALATIGRKDLAHEIQGLSDAHVYKISKKIGFDEWQDVAFVLGLEQSEINQIKEKDSDPKQWALNMLIKWRNRQSTKQHGREVLCLVLESVGNGDLADELRKDIQSFMVGLKRLQKLACMLNMEPGSEELFSEIGHPITEIIINNKEDLRSFNSDLRDADKPLELNKIEIYCNSLEELELQRKILHSKMIVSKDVYLSCSLSDKWKQELQCLMETFQCETKFQHVRQTLFGYADDDDGYDMKYTGRCIRNIAKRLSCRFGIIISGMMRSGSDVEVLVDSLKDCKLYEFGCLKTKLHGHVAHLAPVITSSLNTLWLDECHLNDDDIPDLISILPEGHGLYKLDVSGNRFTLAMLDTLTAHLKNLPKFVRLNIRDVGLGAGDVKQTVLQNLLHLKEVELGMFKE